MICLRLYRVLYTLLRWLHRGFFDPREPTYHVHPSELPWVWIGVTRGGTTDTMTDRVNQSVRSGDIVTPSYLEHMTQIRGTWTYIDSRTLTEEQIPIEGLTIECQV